MRAFNINLRRYKVRFRRMGLAMRIRTRRVSGFSDAIGGFEIARIDHRFDFFFLGATVTQFSEGEGWLIGSTRVVLLG